MPAPAAIRDSFFGHLVHYLSNYKLFQHPEEVPGSPIPARYLSYPGSPGVASPATSDASSATLSGQPEDEDAQIPAEDSRAETDAVAPTNHQRGPDDSFNADVEKGDAAKAKETVMRREISDSALVDWYGPDDPENPYNVRAHKEWNLRHTHACEQWSLLKKCFFTFQVCFLTFSVYIGASIYAPGSAGIADQFGISETAATLGLTLFVAGYGVGPMFLSPLSEVPQIGRTTVYIICLVIFVAIQVPTALAKNLGALLPLRFLAGFVGSPALATGGASLGDIWAVETRSVSIGLWSLAGACGPTLGPLIGGFAVQYKDWTWSIWILLWLSGGTTIMLFFFLPETYDETYVTSINIVRYLPGAYIGPRILYRRASRLRRLTGNPKLKSRGEIELENTTIGEQLHTTLIRPFILGFVEPIVIFWNLYITLVYSESCFARLLPLNDLPRFRHCVHLHRVVPRSLHRAPWLYPGAKRSSLLGTFPRLWPTRGSYTSSRVCFSERCAPTRSLCHTEFMCSAQSSRKEEVSANALCSPTLS